MIKLCPKPEKCEAETDYGTGVTECPCGLIGWLDEEGDLYNHPPSLIKKKSK
jgi:hypothetical protein